MKRHIFRTFAVLVVILLSGVSAFAAQKNQVLIANLVSKIRQNQEVLDVVAAIENHREMFCLPPYDNNIVLRNKNEFIAFASCRKSFNDQDREVIVAISGHYWVDKANQITLKINSYKID